MTTTTFSTTEELKNAIVEANRAYRLGRPVMSDQHFDDLCDLYEAAVTAEEYAEFRNSLHEETGKVRHPYIMGSLDKLKSDEPATVVKWLKDSIGVGNEMSISAKVDGISCRLHYDAAGNFVSATTRGDGTFGIDCTDKAKFIAKLPNDIKRGFKDAVAVPEVLRGELDIRGELVINDEAFADIADQFANPRNACAGAMNHKTANPVLLSHVSFLAYEVMGGKLTKGQQFKLLEYLGFNTPWHVEERLEEPNDALVEKLTHLAETHFGYPTDGLVLSASSYKAEDRYRPVNQRAFKINQQGGETTVVDVEWGDPSKDGRRSPVAIIDPIEIAGSTISRVTLNNVDWMREMRVGIGSRVFLIKSGDVIPKIVQVVDNTNYREPTIPDVCPVCGAHLVLDSMNVRCPNEECLSRGYESVLTFITNMGIKRVSRKTLEAWGVSSIQKMLEFKADPNYKMEVHFERELNRVFSAKESEIFKALPFTDLAEITLAKILSYYGFLAIKAGVYKEGYPEGVAEKTLDAFKSCCPKNLALLALVVSDPRYRGVKAEDEVSEAEPAALVESRGSICFTGALETMTRSEATKRAQAAGFEVRTSVSKGLTYLVTNDPNSGSSKNKKAQQLGTKIVTEQEFLAFL